MKRKTPIEMSLVEDSELPSDCNSPMASTTKRTECMQTYYKPVATQISSVLSPVSRVCTPSPPLSPLLKKEVKSIVRQSKKRRLVRYQLCSELVDPERDLSIASNYEMLLFSHMVMEKGRSPCFRCRLCPKSKKSTFFARSIGDFEETTPFVEQHLLSECQACPSWLKRGIIGAKDTHEICNRKHYSHLVWKRVLAHTIYSQLNYTRRVKFAEKLCHERIIPGRIVA